MTSLLFQTNQKGDLIYETCHLFPASRVLHAFTTRHGGVSQGFLASLNLDHKQDSLANVAENHRRLAAALGYDPHKLVGTRQIHSDIIRIAQNRDGGRPLTGNVPYECDALLTDQPGRPLICYAADCLPILLYAPADIEQPDSRTAVAAIHAGWRGTQADIAVKTLRRMQKRYHTNPAHCLAVIGPGIGSCCFSTHADVPDALLAAFGPEVQQFWEPHPSNGEKFLVNLKAINAWRLQQAGLPLQNIAVSPECTCCKPQKYWSHRFTKGQRGTQAAVIMLR